MKTIVTLLLNRLLRPGLFIFLACFFAAPAARASGVITGTLTDLADGPPYSITDGTHSATFWWSQANDSLAYVYTTFDTAVAVATGITNVIQITNAANFTFITTSYTDPLPDGDSTGIGTFVILRNPATYYAVVRLDNVTINDTLNATWWLQTNGTADFSSFTPPPPPPPPLLAAALNATNLTWITAGNTNPWFVETTNTYDGISAAQNGHIPDGQTNWIQTTIPTNGQISFYWKVSSEEDADYLTFYINGVDQDAISGDVDWYWNGETYEVSAGDVLRWEYLKDGGGSDGSDAGWVDQVLYTPTVTPPPPVTASFDLVLVRTENYHSGTHGFSAIPKLTAISPVPTTTHRIESSGGQIHGDVFSGHSSWDSSSSPNYSTLDQLIQACTNGQWTLYINQGAANERQFYFKVSITGLTTNLLKPVIMTVPALNAVNVATNSPFQWSGPSGFSSIFINAYHMPGFASYQNDIRNLLPGTATNWPSSPFLAYGSNGVTMVYTYTNFPNVTCTTPTNGTNPVSSWIPSADLQSSTQIPYIVGAPAPLPVQLDGSSSSPGGGNFQLSFQTLAGRLHKIQVRTNLTSGSWLDVTNFIGNGSIQQFSIPTTNAPAGFYRVITQ